MNRTLGMLKQCNNYQMPATSFWYIRLSFVVDMRIECNSVVLPGGRLWAAPAAWASFGDIDFCQSQPVRLSEDAHDYKCHKLSNNAVVGRRIWNQLCRLGQCGNGHSHDRSCHYVAAARWLHRAHLSCGTRWASRESSNIHQVHFAHHRYFFSELTFIQ